MFINYILFIKYLHNLLYSLTLACHFTHFVISDFLDMEFDIDEAWNDLFSDSGSVEFEDLSKRVLEQVTFLYPKYNVIIELTKYMA